MTKAEEIKYLKQQLAQRDSRIIELAAARESYLSQAAENRGRADKAEKALEAARGQFADLKERLFKSEMDRARLIGALDRQHELDRLATPHVRHTVTTEGPPALVQRDDRPLRATASRDRFRPSIMVAESTGRHWTDL